VTSLCLFHDGLGLTEVCRTEEGMAYEEPGTDPATWMLLVKEKHCRCAFLDTCTGPIPRAGLIFILLLFLKKQNLSS
jgi:hypothetical protein